MTFEAMCNNPDHDQQGGWYGERHPSSAQAQQDVDDHVAQNPTHKLNCSVINFP